VRWAAVAVRQKDGSTAAKGEGEQEPVRISERGACRLLLCAIICVLSSTRQ
jgi:hypothetical protein